MTNRVQTIRYYTTLQRPPVSEPSGMLYVNFADLQIGALDTSHSPNDFVGVRYFTQLAKYFAGDFAIFEGNFYRCIGNTGPGAFNPTRWSIYSDIDEIRVLIGQETTRAEAAEAHLQSEIDQEITDRQNADTNLQNEINALTTALGNVLPVGVSMDYYGLTAPTGWLLEDGATYPVNTYPALGAFLGGSPGGNFQVPDSRNRFGYGAGPGNPLKATGGAASATLGVSNLPSHTHTIAPHNHTITQTPHNHAFGSNTIGMQAIVSGIGFAAGPGAPPAVNLTGDIQPANAIITINNASLTTDAIGGGLPVNTLPPYITRTRIIKT